MNMHVTPVRKELDDELIALGRQLQAAWTIEKDVCQNLPEDGEIATRIVSNVCDATGLIVDRIERLPAHSLKGLQVKALAFLWTRNDEDFDTGDASETASKEERLRTQIVRGLIAIAA